MKGDPWTTLIEGAKQVAYRIYDRWEFKMFCTFFFNHLVLAMPTDNIQDFNDKINKVNPLSKTDFVWTLKKIITYWDRHSPEDLTILFLTDGNDTCNKPEAVQSTLNELKQYLKIKEITSRFYTIGLSSDHDAVLLSKIAQIGSDLGNFFFVDYNENNETRTYKDAIKECLVKTFDLGVPGGSLNIELNYGNLTKRMYLSPINQETEENKLEEGTKIFEGSSILDSLPEGELELKLLGAEHSIFVQPVESQNVDLKKKLKAESSIVNQIMFNLIQNIIEGSSLDISESKKVYEKLQILDDRVNEMVKESFRMKKGDDRKIIIQSCQVFKDKLFTVIETLREVIVNRSTMDIARIARLNDLAYKTIRSRGIKRKLDERALRNEQYYKKLEIQMHEMLKEFDFNKIAQENQEVIDLVGDWPLTWLTAIEAIQEGDCLGIWLDVARSEAAIMDPNQLIVKDVIPTFMSWNAYLDSAAYNLERQSTAHGTFDKNTQGSLATGIGREDVTGVLPLYLFDEHWEIAKRTSPWIFGFMWTLDIMGYSEDQFYIVPLLVYFKCLEKFIENPSDINKKMLNLVKDTCVQIIKRSDDFGKIFTEKLRNFEAAPINRTKDWIPNFRVFLAQALCAIEAGVIKKDEFDWMKIIRFIIEEGSRRLISKTAEVPSKRAQWDYFNGNKTSKIIEKAMSLKNLNADHKMSLNDILNKLSGGNSDDNPEEAKKLEALIEEEVESQPWYDRIIDPESQASIGINSFYSSINKSNHWIKVFIIALKSDTVPLPESMKDLEWFKDEIIPFAMLYQNMLHPTARNRREAIESKRYVEIYTKEDAEKYLKEAYRGLICLEISGEESKILMKENEMMYTNISERSLFVKDIPEFAEMVTGLMVGDGGVANLIKKMERNTSLNAFEKLKVIINMEHDGSTIFSDKYKAHPGKLKLKSKHKYWLYIRYCYNSSSITKEQFKELFPEIPEEKIIKWEKCYRAWVAKGWIKI